MAEHRRTLLSVTVVGPDLPLPVHLHQRLAVCFCGRPLEGYRWERLEKDKPPEFVRVVRCPVCDWQSPWMRAVARVHEDADELMEAIERSVAEAHPAEP